MLHAAVGELLHGAVDDLLKLVAPDRVELVDFLVLVDSVLREVANEWLGCFSIFLGLQPIVLDLLLPVLLALVTVTLLLDFGWKDCWSREDLVEVLELLPCFVLIRVGHGLSIDLVDIRKPIHNEGPQQYSIRHLIVLYWEWVQRLKRFKLRDLDETIDVVVLEQKTLEVYESLQLGNVGRTDDVIEADVLEWDLDHSLLKLNVVEHLKGISIDEQQLVTLNLSVTRLN